MVREIQKKVFARCSFKKLVKSAIFIFAGLLTVIFFWQYDQNSLVSLQYLDQYGTTHTIMVSVKDRSRLAGLMQKLFAEDSFAYTVLGSKPVSWQSYQNPLPLSSWTRFYDSFSELNRTLRSGWKTWEKYQHLFPSAHLWIESPKCYPGLTSILIVNEDRFNDVVNNNKRDFEEVLCREVVNGVQLLKEAKNRSLMNEVLEGHQALIGIVLGYGRDNSWKFHESCRNRTVISWVWEGDDGSFVEDSMESDRLTDYYLSHYSCPSFAGNPTSAESLALKAEYLLTKQKLIQYYKDKDFLEATLSLLAGHRPANCSALPSL